MVSDRIPDRKVADIAASLVAAAASANGSIDEKEREINEVITGLQILREKLIRGVSFNTTNHTIIIIIKYLRKKRKTLFKETKQTSNQHLFPSSRILCDCWHSKRCQ